MVGALFGVLTLIAGIWSIVVYQRFYNSAVEFLPPQFQDDLTSRYALSEWALSHPMPLALQAEYVRLAKGGCVAFLCGALTLCCIQQHRFWLPGPGGLFHERVQDNPGAEDLRTELQQGSRTGK
jgi:hypothetical protein